MRLAHIVLTGALLLPAWTAAQVTPPARQVPVRAPNSPTVHYAPVDVHIQPPGQYTMAPPNVQYASPTPWRQPQQFHQEDPADSVFRAAYAFFSRQEYRQAAERFSNLRSRFATSRYYCDAAYYEAFSRQRLGTQADLRNGYRVPSPSSTR